MKTISIATYKTTISPTALPDGYELIEFEKGKLCDAEIIVWSNEYPFTRADLALLPKLAVFINWGTNDSNIHVRSLLEKKGINIRRVDYYATEALAEYILLLMLAHERKLFDLKAGKKIEGNEISSKSVGIIGLGKIGFRIGQILHHSFGCSIRYTATSDKFIHNFKYSSLQELLKESDYIILSLKDDMFTLKLDDLKQANKNALIINITNEKVLEQIVIEKALRRGFISGYIADLRGIEESHDLLNKELIIPKAGYLTKPAKENKLHILQLILKKYAAQRTNKTSNIYIVRHGGTVWNERNLFQGTYDSRLTQEGEKHARDIAAFLKDKSIAKIYTSPLGRAIQTAKALQARLSCEYEIVPEFHEIDFGIFQGKNKDEMKAIFSDFFQARADNEFQKLYQHYPEGESYYDVYLRVLHKTLELAATQDNFVIVGHEGINRVIRAIINEQRPEESVYNKQANDEVVEICLSDRSEHLIKVGSRM